MEEASGRVREVERLLQVVTVLRAAEARPISRTRLSESVAEYAAAAAGDTRNKMMVRDQKRLRELGFAIEDVAPAGEESAYVLRDGAWRLPLDLEPLEQRLLVWVLAAAGAQAAEESSGVTAAEDLSSLLGVVPRGLDLAQAAIAGRRRLVVERDGRDVEFEPGLLASRHGRWFLLGRYVGEAEVKGPRLDRMLLVRLGEPMPTLVDIPDPEAVLDPTAWVYHEPRDAELCCATADLGAVSSWFPRAEVEEAEPGMSRLRFSYRHEAALVSRVIGLAGAVWIVSPTTAVTALREQLTAVVGDAAT